MTDWDLVYLITS